MPWLYHSNLTYELGMKLNMEIEKYDNLPPFYKKKTFLVQLSLKVIEAQYFEMKLVQRSRKLRGRGGI